MTNETEEFKIPPRLTTIDNPWNPFTHFSEWYKEDLMSGYNTSAVYANALNEELKKVDLELDELSDEEYYNIANLVIENIIADFPLLYKKVDSTSSYSVTV